MLGFGTYYLGGEKLGQMIVFCPNCKKKQAAGVRISNKITHVLYVPLRYKGKKLVFACHECKKQFEFPDEKSIISALKHFKKLPKGTPYKGALKKSGVTGALYCIPAWIIITVIAVLVLSALGLEDDWYEGDLSEYAKPYVDAIVKNDPVLRQKAIDASKDCWSGDKECQLISIYDYVVHDIKYYSDPRDDEYIQTPYQTLEYKGGDCEDLAALLNSLLESIGIKTLLVLSESHAYSLACGFDVDLLRNYTRQKFIATKEVSRNTDTITLEPKQTSYIGGDETYTGNTWLVNLSFQATSPVNVFTVPTRNDYVLFLSNEGFNYYHDCSKQGVTQTDSHCVLENTGGVVFSNPMNTQSTIKLDILTSEQYPLIDLEKIQINYYEINGEKCVILDPTLGEFGYAGYDTQITGEKTAIDPVTHEQYQLA